MGGIVDGVAKAVNDRLPARITHLMAGVSEVEIPASVRPDHEGMHGVVVLRIPSVGEQRLLPVRHQVAVIVVEDKHIWRTRHDHLAAGSLADHADPQGAVHVAALIKNSLLVTTSIAVGVFQDKDAVALRASVATPAVVGHLTHPHAARGVDVDIRRAGEQRLGGKQAGRKIVGEGQGRGRLGRLNRTRSNRPTRHRKHRHSGKGRDAQRHTPRCSPQTPATHHNASALARHG